MTALALLTECAGYSRPYTAYPTAKIDKVKDLALIFSLSRLYLLSKTS